MPQENVEFVREAFGHFARTGEFDPGVIHPTAELDNTEGMLEADVYQGHEGFRRFLALLAEMWKQFRFEPQEFIPVGDDQVLVPVRMLTVGRDEIETSAGRAILFTVSEGKVSRVKNFQSKADALEALNLAD